jgi:hypothetical protein
MWWWGIVIVGSGVLGAVVGARVARHRERRADAEGYVRGMLVDDAARSMHVRLMREQYTPLDVTDIAKAIEEAEERARKRREE